MGYGKYIILFILLVNIAIADNYVDTDDVYISVSPESRVGSGWVENQFYTKQYTGNVSLLFGFDSSAAVPSKVQYYDPWEKVTYHDTVRTYQDITAYQQTADDCQVGDPVLNDKRIKIFYNMTSKVLCYDSFYNIDDDYTVTFKDSAVTLKLWKSYKGSYDKFTGQDIDGKDIWYRIEDKPVDALTLYKLRFWLDIQPGKDGKYDFAMYPSSYGNNIRQAYQDGNMMILDPYFNGTLLPAPVLYYSFDTDCSDDIGDNDCSVQGDTVHNNTGGFINDGVYWFDGDQDYLEIPDDLGWFDGTSNNFTVTIAVKAGAGEYDGSDWKEFIQFEGEKNVGLDYDKGTDKLRGYVTYDVAGWKPVYSSATVSAPGNVWIVVTMAYLNNGGGSGGLYFYKNGIFQDSEIGNTGSIDTQSLASRIAIFRDTLTRDFRGYIDEVAIWDQYINSTSVQDIYEHQTNGYRLDEESGVPSDNICAYSGTEIIENLNKECHFWEVEPGSHITFINSNLVINNTLSYDRFLANSTVVGINSTFNLRTITP